MEQRAVSVVVSTYRRDTVLVRALDSLAAQTADNFEIVVVDDNGDPAWNNRVEAIVRDFQKRNPNLAVMYVCNERNLGSAEARNRGIGEASGTYVTFLDDDDVYLPDKIRNQVACMEAENLDYCVTDLDLYYDNETLSEKRTRGAVEKLGQAELFCYHFMHHITGTDTMMFRREYLQQIGGFPPINVGDEFYLMQRAIENGGKFGYMHRCDVKAYVHTGEGGLSSGRGKLDGENRLYEFKKGYFHRFDAKSIRFIRMRHYAVLAFAELRKRNYARFLYNGMLSFVNAPVQCVCFLCNRRSGNGREKQQKN